MRGHFFLLGWVTGATAVPPGHRLSCEGGTTVTATVALVPTRAPCLPTFAPSCRFTPQ